MAGSNHTSQPQSEGDELYPGHIPTTNFQKALLTVTSAIAAITDPARDGEQACHFVIPVVSLLVIVY